MGKNFAKPALPIADQIILLKNKNMLIPDEAKAKHCLAHIGFYHLSAYWFPYKTGTGYFQSNTDFNEIIALYEFDRELKLLIMAAAERIEISVRESFVRAISLKYGAHGYLDWRIYKTASPLAKIITNMGRELSRPNNLFTQHYKDNYSNPFLPPLWINAELLSFGALSKLIADLDAPSDRNALAKNYAIDETLLIPALHHLVHIRNICAHHGRLWNQSLTRRLLLPKHGLLKQALNHSIRNKIYNTLCCIAYFMQIIAPHDKWKGRIKTLFLHHDAAYAPPQSMGFPADWTARGLWAGN